MVSINRVGEEVEHAPVTLPKFTSPKSMKSAR